MALGAVEIGIMKPNDAPRVAPSTAGTGDAPVALDSPIASGTISVAVAVLLVASDSTIETAVHRATTAHVEWAPVRSTSVNGGGAAGPLASACPAANTAPSTAIVAVRIALPPAFAIVLDARRDAGGFTAASGGRAGAPRRRERALSKRRNFATGTAWEPLVGYSRAVRVGDLVFVSGTTATDADGAIVGAGDAAAQTRQVVANLRAALERAGARLEDVVRTRIFVTDIGQWEAVGRAHGEAFGAIRPACTMVEVARLIAPEILVEIEADAVVGAGGDA